MAVRRHMLPQEWTPQTFMLIAVGAALSCLFTGIARGIAPRLGFLDRPDARKAHEQPTPLLGGLAIYAALLATLTLAAALGEAWATSTTPTGRFTAALLLSGGFYCAIGLWDDRWGLRPRTKFLLQIAAAVPFVFWGRAVEDVHLLGWHIELGVAGAACTVFWLVGCVNAINLLDGLDGLAGTVGMVICLSVGLHTAMSEHFLLTPVPVVVSACILGFLCHNWPPARIFLGDAGSLTIGFLVGALSIEGSLKTATGLALTVPLVLISVPVFDTLMAIVRRKLSGRGIGEADRGHIHHCLQNRGLSGGQCLLAIAGLCVSMAAATLLSAYFQNDAFALVICGLVLVLLIVGRVFGYDETVLLFRWMSAASALLSEASGLFRSNISLVRLRGNGARAQRDAWDELTRQLGTIGAGQLEFVSWRPDEQRVLGRLSWQAAPAAMRPQSEWEFRYSMTTSDGVQRTLFAAGHAAGATRTGRWLNLHSMFALFCEGWSDELPSQPAGEQPVPDVLMFPRREAPSAPQSDRKRVA